MSEIFKIEFSPTLIALSTIFSKFKEDNSEVEPEKSTASFPIFLKLRLIIFPSLKSISIASCFVFIKKESVTL